MWRISNYIVSSTLISLLSACSLVPEYQRPDVALPAHWAAQDLPLTSSAPVSAQWWQQFNSAQLNDLMQTALSHNQTLAQAIAKINEARATAQIAGAPLYPTVSLNGTANFASSHTSSTATTKSLFAQAAYEIDFWGSHRAASHASDALAQATVYDADTAALTLTAAVADTYFQLLALKERLLLAEHIHDNARHLLTLVQAQVDYGVTSPLTLAQQQNAVANFAANIPAIKLQIDQNLHLLSVLTGQTPDKLTLPDATINSIPMIKVSSDLPASLLYRRPDIQAAENRLQAANFDIGVARAAFFPSLSLTGKYGYTNSAVSHLFSADPVSTLTASLLQPIFNAGELTGQLHYNKARVTELSAAYRQTILTALQEVEDALSASYYIDDQARHELDATLSARKAFYLSSQEYQAGTVDFLNVLTTQRTLYQAEDTYIQTHLKQLQASVTLFRTLGGGFDASASTVQHLFSEQDSGVTH